MDIVLHSSHCLLWLVISRCCKDILVCSDIFSLYEFANSITTALTVEAIVCRYRDMSGLAFDTSAVQEKLSTLRGMSSAFAVFIGSLASCC